MGVEMNCVSKIFDLPLSAEIISLLIILMLSLAAPWILIGCVKFEIWMNKKIFGEDFYKGIDHL